METRGKKTAGTRELRSATKARKDTPSASTSTPPTATRSTRATAATNNQLSGSQISASKSSKALEDASQTKKAGSKVTSKATPAAPLNKRARTLDDNDREPIKVRRQDKHTMLFNLPKHRPIFVFDRIHKMNMTHRPRI